MNDAIYKLIRKHYQALQGYVSAGMEITKSDDKIFLNANENPFELPGLEGANRYPEPQPAALVQAMADNYGVNNDQIVVTRGADEALVVLTKVFCEPHEDAILINPPTFGMYGVDARAMPANVVEVPLLKQDNTFALDQDEIIAQATNPLTKIKMVFICSPNNPTGGTFPQNQIRGICTALEGHAIIILDETYCEFTDEGSMVDDLKNHPNLIILRTLSKSYAFAGLRIGCFLSGDTDFIALVKAKALDAYPLPRASVEGALHVLSPAIKALAQENICKLLDERARVETALKNSAQIVKIYDSAANFLLIEMKDAKGFYDYALENNVVLRDFSSKPLTENCLRISIGTPMENDMVLKLLEEFDNNR